MTRPMGSEPSLAPSDAPCLSLTSPPDVVVQLEPQRDGLDLRDQALAAALACRCI
jgi:hypothetical protein